MADNSRDATLASAGSDDVKVGDPCHFVERVQTLGVSDARRQKIRAWVNGQLRNHQVDVALPDVASLWRIR